MINKDLIIVGGCMTLAI